MWDGWLVNFNNVPQAAREFWKVRDEISVADCLLFLGERLVIPDTMKKVALEAIHEGYLGIETCKQKGRSCVHWPVMNADIEQLVKQYEICSRFATSNHKEPMIPHDIPARLCKKLALIISPF